MASVRREPMACRNVSRPSGVRVISTCGAPAAAVPSSSSGPASSLSCGTAAAGTVLSRTFTGSRRRPAPLPPSGPRSSRRRTRPSRVAPIPWRRPYPPSRARPGSPSSMPMTCAARSGGTFPYHDSSTAAAFSTGRTKPPLVRARRPIGGLDRPAARAAQARQRHSVTARMIFISVTCAHRKPVASAPSSPALQLRHSAFMPPGRHPWCRRPRIYRRFWIARPRVWLTLVLSSRALSVKLV